MEIHTAEGLKPMTEKEMIEKFGVDVNKRESERLKHNTWSTTVKRSDGEISQVPNYQTTLQLKRLYPEYIENTQEILSRLLQIQAPKTELIEARSSGLLASILLPDVHLDKMDTSGTTVSQKTDKIIHAIHRINERLKIFAPELVQVGVLGDFFNTHANGTTSKGTPQENTVSDLDAREAGIKLNTMMLSYLSEYRPVVAKYIRGNHEGEKINYLQHVLKYFFSNNPNITIDMSTEELQSIEWGINSLRLNHGDKMRPQDLAMQATKKAPQGSLIEVYTGHKHKNITQSYQGVLVHTFGAVGSLNEWSKRHGVDHANGEIYTTIHHKVTGKVAVLREIL